MTEQMNGEINKRLVSRRLEEGLAFLRERYNVVECEMDPAFRRPVVGGRPYCVQRYNIEGVGNLLTMSCTEVEENQLSSFVIMPYYKNLPLFSTDYVYNADKRFFLIELYDLCAVHDRLHEEGMGRFAACADAWNDMPDFPTRPCWYDDIRPVCLAKAPSAKQDELALERFIEALGLFVQMEHAAPLLDEAGRAEKWQLNKGYSDRLVDEGGVSTDRWTEALGAENVRRFFDEVFFGPACYRP